MAKFLFAALVLLACTASAAEQKTMPAFTSTTVEGKTLHLEAGKMKKPALIAFWATWCELCRQEVPHLNKFQNAHGSQIDVIGVNIDDEFKTAKAYIKKEGIDYVNVSDEKGSIADRFGIIQTPTLYVVDAKGKILKEATVLKDVKDLLLSLVPNSAVPESSDERAL
jgi:thiol-disulfide isomerase/thioredoxin